MTAAETEIIVLLNKLVAAPTDTSLWQALIYAWARSAESE